MHDLLCNFFVHKPETYLKATRSRLQHDGELNLLILGDGGRPQELDVLELNLQVKVHGSLHHGQRFPGQVKIRRRGEQHAPVDHVARDVAVVLVAQLDLDAPFAALGRLLHLELGHEPVLAVVPADEVRDGWRSAGHREGYLRVEARHRDVQTVDVESGKRGRELV